MRRTALVEDLNHLACPEAQDHLAGDADRARETFDNLRFIDTSELDRYEREGWLDREEVDLIERFAGVVRDQLGRVPEDRDPVAFTRADRGWQLARERARELLIALDAFIDIGVPGWGQQYRA